MSRDYFQPIKKFLDLKFRFTPFLSTSARFHPNNVTSKHDFLEKIKKINLRHSQ
jgi:hypothetical protein